jgi:hypothetical protein
MGQEASLPEQQDEDFVEQAKAPPSAADPNDLVNGSGRSKQVSGRRIGAMFQRGNHPHDLDREAARVAAEAGEMPYMEGAVYSNGQARYNELAMAAAHNGQLYQNHQLTPDQQYYQQQQMYENQQQHQIMQQQQPQHHYQQQHQQNAAPYSTRLPQASHQDSEHPSGGGAFASESHGTDRTGGGSAKKAAALRSLGKGAALLNSMRNLSLANSFKTAAAPANDKKGKEVNDWETRWDEDDDDSGEEENEEVKPPSSLHPPLRPGMDAGHSSASVSPTKPQAPVDLLSSPPPYQQQPQQHEQVDLLFFTPPQGAPPPPSSIPPPVQSSAPPSSMQQHHQQQQMTVNQIQQQYVVIDDDGIEWDSGVNQCPERADKPNVKMFLPMLRVLGKGSFGKVSRFKYMICLPCDYLGQKSLNLAFVRSCWFKNGLAGIAVNCLP